MSPHNPNIQETIAQKEARISHLSSMTAAAKHYPLHEVTDDGWNAESVFGRLCIVAHAAFLHAGFVPHGAPAASRWSFSCRYSAPQLVPREGGAAAVMRLTGRGRRRKQRSYMAVQTYLVARDGVRSRERRTRLDNASLAAALSGGVDDVAGALWTPGSAAGWLWQLLADELGRGLLPHLCRLNNCAPVAAVEPAFPAFASLPGDVKVLILGRLDSAEDLAMAECAGKELRDLIAEHDAELWKAMHKRTIVRHSILRVVLCGDFCRSDEENISWKQRFVRAKTCGAHLWEPRRRQFLYTVELKISLGEIIKRSTKPPAATDVPVYVDKRDPPDVDERDPLEMLRVVKANNHAGHAPSCFKAQSNGYRRRHGAGATHSPSSRYRWKHR
ncbi:hypothetical protein ACP70R_020714 [Stipagrostis hirtigluma subsp. patula]